MADNYRLIVGELCPMKDPHPHPDWAAAIKKEVQVQVVKEDVVSQGSPIFREMLQLDYCVVVHSVQLNQDELDTYVAKNPKHIRAECRTFYEELREPPTPPGSPAPSNETNESDQRTPDNSMQEEDHTPQDSMKGKDSTPDNSAKESIESVQPSDISAV